ncbi:MAG: hypothetical protein J6T97_00025 [Bacteroidaceae bacterium]|nr:hypothetical protein [Bacteroidaceae bacterium]
MRNFLTLICVLAASITCKAQVNPNPIFNNVMIKGDIAVVEDMSRMGENCWTKNEVDFESLKNGVFVQLRGEYYLTDGQGGYFKTKYIGDDYYNWADYGDGSLIRYGGDWMFRYNLEAAESKDVTSEYNRIVYFRYDPADNTLYRCILRSYLGKYDWHDIYFQGFVRSIDGIDPITGYYSDESFNDPLYKGLYSTDRVSEWTDSVMFFDEKPYQVDGPCILMYKGQPWTVKLTQTVTLNEEQAQERYTQPGTPYQWVYSPDPDGDTIVLQSGVYLFTINIYEQETSPLKFTAMRLDIGKFDIVNNDTLLPAESYQVVDEATPDGFINPTGNGIYLSSYYSYQTRERKYKYKDYVTPYGNSRKMVWYYEYHTHKSSTHTDYPVSGLAEQLGYSGCIAIPYGSFNSNSTHSNYAKLYDGSFSVNIGAEKGKGVPVVIYNRSNKSTVITYITYEQYQAIKASVAPIQGTSGEDIIYDLNGRQVNEADMQTGRIYIRNRRPMILR